MGAQAPFQQDQAQEKAEEVITLHWVHDCKPTLVVETMDGWFIQADYAAGVEVFLYWIMFLTKCDLCARLSANADESGAYKISLN